MDYVRPLSSLKDSTEVRQMLRPEQPA
jgi:hypothetical protein